MEQQPSPPTQAPQQHTVWKDLIGSLVDLDHGIPGTLKALLLHPALVLRSYISGERAYVNPFRLLLITAGLYYLLHTFLIDESVYVRNMLASVPKSEITDALGNKTMEQTQLVITKLQSEYGTFSMASMALLIAFVFWLMSRRTVGTFAVALAGSSYVFALFMALSLVLILPAEVLLYRNAAVLPAFLNAYNWVFFMYTMVWFIRTFNIAGIWPRVIVGIALLISYVLYSALLFMVIGFFVGLNHAG